MKILTGFLAPTSGTATILGIDVAKDPRQAQRYIGYLPENAPFYPEMRVIELLEFVAQARGMSAIARARGIERVSAQCGIADRLPQAVGTLSKGYRQRVGLAQALLHEPQLLILDEPTSGLDPNQIVEIRDLIRQVGKTRTVIVSTHILSEVEVTCDRVLVLHQGQLVADGPTRSITQGSGSVAFVSVAPGKVQASAETLCAQIGAISGVLRTQVLAPNEDGVRIRVEAVRDVRGELFDWAVLHGHRLVDLHGERAALEEVFRRLTGSP